MRGSAVATTTESRTTMKYAVEVRPRTQPRWVLARVFVTITPQGAPVRAAGDVDTGPAPELAPGSFQPGRCPCWPARRTRRTRRWKGDPVSTNGPYSIDATLMLFQRQQSGIDVVPKMVSSAMRTASCSSWAG